MRLCADATYQRLEPTAGQTEGPGFESAAAGVMSAPTEGSCTDQEYFACPALRFAVLLEHSSAPGIVDTGSAAAVAAVAAVAVAVAERTPAAGPAAYYSAKMGSDIAGTAAGFAVGYCCHRKQRFGSQESVQSSDILVAAEHMGLSGSPLQRLRLAESADG